MINTVRLNCFNYQTIKICNRFNYQDIKIDRTEYDCVADRFINKQQRYTQHSTRGWASASYSSCMYINEMQEHDSPRTVCPPALLQSTHDDETIKANCVLIIVITVYKRDENTMYHPTSP